MEWQKPHVAIFPGFGSGHHIPLLELAKRLTVYHGFSVIFFTAKWMGASPQPILPSSSGSKIRFIELPDVQIEGNHAEMPFLIRIPLLLEKAKILVEDALTSFSFPVCAFIIDFFGTPMLDVASKLEIPSYIFFPSAAFILCITLYLPTLAHNIETSFKDVDIPIEVPGLPPIPGIDLPGPLQDRSDISFNRLIQHSLRLHEACGILINTCQEMEPEQVKALKEGKVLSVPEKRPSIYAVGPLISSSLSEYDDNYEKEGCLKWLDRQPASCVLFVAFGSRGTLSENQITELALGLEASGQRFLWVLRREPPPPTESAMTAGADMREVLPEGFETRTEDRGFVVDSWAPQISVLSHPSTGGFLSHCGWNSTIESMLHGVPMIAWPLFAEQKTNAFFLVKQMKVAIEAEKGPDGLVKREEVERAARELLEGEGGMEMKKRMAELMEKARFAMAEGGSSYNALASVASVWKEMHQEHYCFLPETALLATNYLDRFLSCTQVQQQKSWAIQLASVACLSLAAKMEERHVPLLFALQVGEAEHVFEPRTIQRMELLLLSALKWRMKAVTPLSYLQYGGHILGLEKQFHGEFIMRSSELALCTINETRLLKFMPSVIAAVIMLWVAREMEVINLNECEDRLLSRLKVAKGPLQCCYQLLQVSFGQAHVRKRKVCSSFSKPDSPHRVLDAAFSFSTEHSQKSSAKYTVSSPSSSPSVPNKRRITE